MGLKVDTCCWFIELRAGCIVIGIFGTGFTIISIALTAEFFASAIIGYILTILGNGCLIGAAVFKSGRIQIRSIAVLVYIVLVLLNAIIDFIATIFVCVALNGVYRVDDGYGFTIRAVYAPVPVIFFIWIFLDVYFVLVAFSFYQELKKESTTNAE
jgi:hypothetical protein